MAYTDSTPVSELHVADSHVSIKIFTHVNIGSKMTSLVMQITSGIQLSTSDCTHQGSEFSKSGWLRTCDSVCT